MGPLDPVQTAVQCHLLMVSALVQIHLLAIMGLGQERRTATMHHLDQERRTAIVLFHHPVLASFPRCHKVLIKCLLANSIKLLVHFHQVLLLAVQIHNSQNEVSLQVHTVQDQVRLG